MRSCGGGQGHGGYGLPCSPHVLPVGPPRLASSAQGHSHIHPCLAHAFTPYIPVRLQPGYLGPGGDSGTVPAPKVAMWRG